MNKKITLPILFISIVGVLFSFSVREASAATEILRPNAPGDVTNIESQYPSSGAHWDKVDESTADTTTYVYSAVGSFRSDLYNLPNHTGSGTINFVKFYYRGRCKNVDTSGCTVCGYLKTNNDASSTGSCIQIATWTTNSRQYDTNPVTGLAWTWAEIDALQIGGYIGGADDAHAAQLTQVYVEINYTPTGVPTVTNSIGASNVSTTSARLNGEITSIGGEVPTVRIYWGDNDGGTNPADWDYTESLGIQSGTFYKDISGLNSGTGYYYRCYASNSYGSDWADSTDSFLTQSEGGGTVFYGTASGADFDYQKWSSSPSTSWNTAHDATSGDLNTGRSSLRVKVRNWKETDPTDYEALIYRAVVYFDTFPLPNDATITSAVLKLYGSLEEPADQDFGPFTIQVQSGMPTYPHDPPVGSDYNYTRYSDNVGILSLLAVGTGNGYREVQLNSTGLSLINKTGTTKFMLREKEHDVDDVQPPYTLGRHENSWSFSSSESAYPPILEITYTTPATAPTVATELATINLSTNQATLKGKVTATGGEDPDHRYIDWDTDASGEPYANTVDLGAGGTGEFSTPLTLIPGTIYYYRARAHNSAGDGKGNERHVVIYQDSGGQESFTTESVCKNACESCSTGECCSGLHCQNGVCCVDGQTCCTGDTHCPADSCINSSQHVDNYCNTGVCYCESSTTTCAAGGCCQIACGSATGCYTTAGTCPDSCGTNTLTIGQTCSGCGANGAAGSCTGGTTYTCNAATHTECQSASCGGMTYYCTQDGGTWQWRTSDNPDRCGGNSDDCYDDYGSGCQTKDFKCSAGACIFTPSNQYTDTSCSYTGCSADNCTKTGAYEDYYCDAGSCTAHSDSCFEDCTSNTVCSVGICSAGTCGTKDCPDDYCSGDTLYDYPSSCNKYCSGGSCLDCTCEDSPTPCGATDCSMFPDTCIDSSLYYDYPFSCDNPCTEQAGDDACGTCGCDPDITTCAAGGCCQIACGSATGCYTTAGTCPDSCGTNTLTIGQTCSGCGANGAAGSCTGGTTYTCNAATHTECQSASCGGMTYYCTQDGGTWQWRTSDNPDRCGGNSDDCYDDYGSGCQTKDFKCSAGACIFTPSNQYTDTSCSYTGCSADNCTKTGAYEDYYCDAGSCTAHSDSCFEDCSITTACSGGVCYSDGGDGDLCNTEMKASPGEGDGNYGIGGNYNCQGSCDGSGNCDYAVNCIPIDTTSPTTAIKIIRINPETGEEIEEVTGGWLKAGSYRIKFEDNDPAPSAGWKTGGCQYYVYACDVNGVNCGGTPEKIIVDVTTRTCGNWSFDITAGKDDPTYNLEGYGRYLIYSIATDDGENSGTDSKLLHFDFTPPETRIE